MCGGWRRQDGGVVLLEGQVVDWRQDRRQVSQDSGAGLFVDTLRLPEVLDDLTSALVKSGSVFADGVRH